MAFSSLVYRFANIFKLKYAGVLWPEMGKAVFNGSFDMY